MKNPTYVLQPELLYMHVDLPKDLLNTLLEDCCILKSNERDSYAENLVGGYKKGAQLEIKHWNGEIKNYKAFRILEKLILELSKDYIKKYVNLIPDSLQNIDIKLSLCDMWLNEQCEGDFIPLHNHRTRAESGLSSFLWLTFPEEVLQEASQVKSYNSGEEGWTHLHWGVTNSKFSRYFQFPKEAPLKPTVGRLFLFPCWLQHIVYPFRTKGLKLSIASNVNVSFLEKQNEGY